MWLIVFGVVARALVDVGAAALVRRCVGPAVRLGVAALKGLARLRWF